MLSLSCNPDWIPCVKERTSTTTTSNNQIVECNHGLIKPIDTNDKLDTENQMDTND